MRSEKILDLIVYLRSQLGASGQDDLLYRWVEEAVGAIRERAWSWNYVNTNDMTYSSFTTPDFYVWTEGRDYLDVVGGGAIADSEVRYTGRRVKLGDEWYTVTDIGLSTASRVYVDRKVVGQMVVPGTKLVYYRTNNAYMTSGINNVSAGLKPKLIRYSRKWFTKNFRVRHWDQISPSTPYGYLDRTGLEYTGKNRIMKPPLYAPSGSDSGAGALTDGTYYYFFTRVDTESGVESKPGPVLKWVNTTGNSPNIIYGNPAGDFSEQGTWDLVLYRSERNPTRTRCPMFKIDTRTPKTPGAPFADGNLGVGQFDQYYDGPWTVIELLPPPSGARVQTRVSHINNWAHRAWDEDVIEMGHDNQMIELLRIYLLGLTRLASNSPQEYRLSIRQFRSQLSYLETQDNEAGSLDQGDIDSFKDYRDQQEYGTGDWVDGLPWGSDY